MTELEQEFQAAINIVNNTKDNKKPLSNTERLEFYKYYKQATIGDCNIPEPYSIYFEAHAKWKAWNSVKGMSKDDAMTAYVTLYNKTKDIES